MVRSGSRKKLRTNNKSRPVTPANQIRGDRADFNLETFRRVNENFDIVNRGICRRIQSVTPRDASPNALVILNLFGQMMKYELDNNLAALTRLYEGADI